MKKITTRLMISAVVLSSAACSSVTRKSATPESASAVKAKIESRDYRIDVPESGIINPIYITAGGDPAIHPQEAGYMYMKGDTLVSCMGYDYMANFDPLEPNDLFQKGKPLPAFKHKIAKYEIREGKKGRLEVSFSIDQYIPRLDKSLPFDFKLTIYPDGKVEISQGASKFQTNKYGGTLQI